jgi:HEAT repeat protein
MKNTDPRSSKKHSKTVAAGLKSRVSFEWPLLIYPVLFLATLAVLFVAGRAIEKETPTSRGQPAGTLDRTDEPYPVPDRAPDQRVPFAGGQAPRTPERHQTTQTDDTRPQRPGNDRGVPVSGRPSSVVGTMRHAVDLSLLKGAAKTTALLCVAVDEKDHARIKQCLAELVALGDEAVAPLCDLLANEQGDAALWAATALARIGTPAAAGALLDRLNQTPESPYKEELAKRISNLHNHDSWPLLLDTMLQANDAAVVRAAGAALATMADAPVIDEAIARYDTATTATEVDRLAQFVRGIRSPSASEPLLSLAGPASAAPQDSLQDAAIAALAGVGDARSVNYLLQRLEASPPGAEGQMFNTIARIDSPEAQAALLYAAAGNKEVSAERGRSAAIYALKNYPDEKTVALLERIVAQEQNEKVLTAALRTLENIQRGPYTVTARAEALQKSEEMLPLPSVEK